MITHSEKMKTPETWEQFLEFKPEFPAMIRRWMLVLRNMAIHTPANEDDLVGHLTMTVIVMSLSDVNDIMTLSHADSHIGALKLLRSLYERVVTLKYISQNPSEAEGFMEFDAVDTEKVMIAIKCKTGMEVGENAQKNLAAAASAAKKKYKQNRPLSWTPLNSKEMADRVGLGHMHLHAFLVASKHIHPTYWSVKSLCGSPLFNTLCITHELIVQLIVLHRRHFTKAFGVTPMMNRAINDFLRIWTISEGTFDGILTQAHSSSSGGPPVYYA
jgi:hypothetical protein